MVCLQYTISQLHYPTWIFDSGKEVYHQKMEKILKTNRPKPKIGSDFSTYS